MTPEELRTIIREELAAVGIPSENDLNTSALAKPRRTARILLIDLIRQTIREELNEALRDRSISLSVESDVQDRQAAL